MLGPCESLPCPVSTPALRKRWRGVPRTLGGLQMSHIWTGRPFLALLTRPVLGVIFGVNWEDAAGWRGNGLWRPPAMDDDEGAEPYREGSIESLLVVLGRRVDCRVVVVADKGGEDDDDDDETAAAAPFPAPLSGCDDVGGADLGLGPRGETRRRLLWPAAGAAGLISCSAVARPGLLTCPGSGSGSGFGCRCRWEGDGGGGASWGGRQGLGGLLAPLSLLLRGARPPPGWWSSLTSIIKLRLAMTGDRQSRSPSKWKSDAKLGEYTALLVC
jgi:hypothetical protein